MATNFATNAALPSEPQVRSSDGLCCTVTFGGGCKHDQNWISNGIKRWYGRQAVKVCLDCGAILDWHTGTEL